MKLTFKSASILFLYAFHGFSSLLVAFRLVAQACIQICWQYSIIPYNKMFVSLIIPDFLQTFGKASSKRLFVESKQWVYQKKSATRYRSYNI